MRYVFPSSLSQRIFIHPTVTPPCLPSRPSSWILHSLPTGSSILIRNFASSSSSSSSITDDFPSTNYYTILGVPETATTKEIKHAFRKMAKQYHPDLQKNRSRNPSSRSNASVEKVSIDRDDEDHFVTIILAYEQLSNPVLRTAYNNQLRLQRQQETSRKVHRSRNRVHPAYPFDVYDTPRSTNSSSSSTRSSATDDMTYDDTSNDNPDRIFGGYNGIARRAQKYGDSSVWKALLEANTGPLFQGNFNDFPYAFELDERNSMTLTNDILHVCIGSGSFLGCVKGCGLKKLPEYKEKSPYLPLEAESTTGTAVTQVSRSMDNSFSSFIAASSDPSESVTHDTTVVGTYDHLEFHYQGKLIASAMMFGSPFSHHPSITETDKEGEDDDDENDASSASEIVNDYITIYRHYEDGTRGPPLAHILSPQGYGYLSMRRIISCDLVNPYLTETEPAAPSTMDDDEISDNDYDTSNHEFIATRHQEINSSKENELSSSSSPSPLYSSLTNRWNSRSTLSSSSSSSLSSVYQGVMDAVIDEHEQGIWRKNSLHISKANKTIHKENPFGSPLNHPSSVMSFAVMEPVQNSPTSGMSNGNGNRSDASSTMPLPNPSFYQLSDTSGGRGAITPIPIPSIPKDESDDSKRKNNANDHQHHHHTTSSAFRSRRSFVDEETYKLSLWNMSHWWPPSTGFIPLDKLMPDPRVSFNRKDVPLFSTHYSRFRTWNDTEKLKTGSSRTFIPFPNESNEWMFSRTNPPRTTNASLTSPDVPHDLAYVHPQYTTHTLLSYQTPGISHVRWIRNIDRYTEAYASRIRLPDSRYWLWEPRSNEHSRGGYNVSVNPRRNIEPSLHPAVYILSAAVLTLEKEYTRELKNITAQQRKEKWSRLFSLWK